MKQASLAALGGRVRRRRYALDWTLDDLAKRAKLSKSFLCCIEHGQQEPGLHTLDRLSRALGLGLNYLIRGRRA